MTAPPTFRRRRGMTLIELLISVVLVGIIGVAASRLMVSQTRFFSRLASQKEARSTTRISRNILQTELSTIEAVGGVVAASNDSITVRAPYAWGVYCSSNTMLQLPIDSAMNAMASFAGYAIKDTTVTGAFTYTESSTAPSSGTATNCTGLSPAITAPTDGSYLGLSPAVTGLAGAPMLLYQTITYKFATSGIYAGKRGLYRRQGSGTPEEIVAPFDTAAKFRYYNLYSDTAQTTVPTLANIRGVELYLKAEGPSRVAGQSTAESVLIKNTIFFRNRTD